MCREVLDHTWVHFSLPILPVPECVDPVSYFFFFLFSPLSHGLSFGPIIPHLCDRSHRLNGLSAPTHFWVMKSHKVTSCAYQTSVTVTCLYGKLGDVLITFHGLLTNLHTHLWIGTIIFCRWGKQGPEFSRTRLEPDSNMRPRGDLNQGSQNYTSVDGADSIHMGTGTAAWFPKQKNLEFRFQCVFSLALRRPLKVTDAKHELCHWAIGSASKTQLLKLRLWNRLSLVAIKWMD